MSFYAGFVSGFAIGAIVGSCVAFAGALVIAFWSSPSIDTKPIQVAEWPPEQL